MPLRSKFLLAATLLVFQWGTSAGLAQTFRSDIPVKGVTFPTFTDEGFRYILLLGDEAKLSGTQRIEVKQMHLTLFNGKADEKVETVLISTAATFFPTRQFAEGEAGVRIITDDFEVTGQKWTYDRLQKKVVLDGRVRAIFRTQLDSLLK